MAHIVIPGAGGMSAAYEMKEAAQPQDTVSVVSNHSFFQFTPSNPCVAAGWRKKEDITLEAGIYLEKKGTTEPAYEKYVMNLLGIKKLK